MCCYFIKNIVMHIFWANGLLDRWLVYNNLHIKQLIFDPPAAS